MAKRKKENKVFLIRWNDSVVDKRYLTRANAFKYALGFMNCEEIYVYEIDLLTHEMVTWMKIGSELKPITEEAKLLYGR